MKLPPVFNTRVRLRQTASAAGDSSRSILRGEERKQRRKELLITSVGLHTNRVTLTHSPNSRREPSKRGCKFFTGYRSRPPPATPAASSRGEREARQTFALRNRRQSSSGAGPSSRGTPRVCLCRPSVHVRSVSASRRATSLYTLSPYARLFMGRSWSRFKHARLDLPRTRF